MSMGGGIVMSFLQRSEFHDRITGVILDAPMLDFSTTVDDNASRETLPLLGVPLPPSLTAVAKWIADERFDIRWGQLDYLDDTSAYEGIPFLVFHGTQDTVVPIATSREFSGLLADEVKLIECPGAGHLECWNVDSERYVSEVLTFIGTAR
jgi:alpha-beta hydrolase superfamily lysophospholipase